MKIRNAERDDARDLTYLINLAGEGIPEYLWTGMVEAEETAMDVGIRRASRDEGGFSYKNARVCVEEKLLGMIISYQQPEPYLIDDLSVYPDVVQPLVQLEAKAPGSWYINAIATYEKHRGKGVAKRLMAEAEELALAAGCVDMSLIVASENIGAKKLYEILGFQIVESLPVLTFPGCLHAGDWDLMIKRLGKA